MFTGIVQSMGQVLSVEKRGGDGRLTFRAPAFFGGSALGDSIAVSGVCLTAVTLDADHFGADVTAGRWQPGTAVNLERALTPVTPLGGHLVSGHVDAVGHLRSRADDARSVRLSFEAPPELARYIARKGSICIDGVSLTVNEVEGARFGVNIVPHTLAQTTLGTLQAGDPVNLEVDLIARYLERLLEGRTL
jgi:riboflavin synthase